MEENYKLYIKGTQTTVGEPDNVEVRTSGAYVLKNGSRYISYREFDPENPEQSYRTTVKVDTNNIVTIIKGGEGCYNLILEKGRRHKCQYATNFGTILLGVYTEDVKVKLNDNGGFVAVNYSIDVDSELASKNELYIKIEEANQA